ncbi:MAG: ATP-grasp domain-containing protein [Methanosarcinales archaeon]
MKIMVAEYAVGDGGEKRNSLLREGGAMLATLRGSFEAIGNEVITPVAEDDFEAAVETYSKESDAGIVIAPEEELYQLTKVVESNTVNLGCPSESVKLCADKKRTTQILSEKGIPVPMIVSRAEREEKGATAVYVKKPRYGCASEDVFIVQGRGIPEDDQDYIVTEFIKGDDISSSVVVGTSSVLPLTINKQFIRVDGGRLCYEGGEVPFFMGQESEKEVIRISKEVATVLHCKGYVGIDFVFGEDGKAYVVDVNPRPTTSVVGIVKVLKYEIADLILRAKFGTLPREEEVKTEGHFRFKLS